MKMKKRHISILFFLTVTIVLTFNFKTNLFSSASDSFFDYFQLDGESMVIGRLLLSEKNGLTDHAGFLGWTHPNSYAVNKYGFQFDAYHKGVPFASYEGYYSHPGAQAFVFGIINKITGWKGYGGLDKLRWIVSFFTALAFTLFLYWVLLNWGLATTAGIFVFILFSQWITVYGRNLFWVLSAFYIPFLTALFWLHWCEKKSADCKDAGTGSVRTVLTTRMLTGTFLLMFGSVFIKFLFTGFEYMTTVMVMAVIPWVFYAIDGKWDIKKTVRSIAAACSGVLTAVLSGVVWLSAQYGALTGSFREGLEYILWSFGKRAHGLPQYTYEPVYEQSIQKSQWEVIVRYLNDHALNIRHWFDNSVWESVGIINFTVCILFFVMMSYLTLSSGTIRKDEAFHRRQKALVWTLWISITAPLSWFVIFKGHAAIHPHMNPIVWYMPFMLFGFLLTCSTCCYLIRNKRWKSSSR
jgi:hypothetical protein